MCIESDGKAHGVFILNSNAQETLAVPDVPLKKTPNENSYKDEKESCETKGDTEEEKTSNDEDSKLNISQFTCASSLMKVDLDGTVINGGSTDFGVNQVGYILHSAVHRAHPEIKCVHLHHLSGVAVSAKKKVWIITGGGVNRQNGHVNSTQWRKGELEWQAYMRQLDAQGYVT
ncbi:unnamed protein product [Caenorhabditis nigoni]